MTKIFMVLLFPQTFKKYKRGLKRNNTYIASVIWVKNQFKTIKPNSNVRDANLFLVLSSGSYCDFQ